jgi:hypothetical protein
MWKAGKEGKAEGLGPDSLSPRLISSGQIESGNQELRGSAGIFQLFLLSTFKGPAMWKAGKEEANPGSSGLIP